MSYSGVSVALRSRPPTVQFGILERLLLNGLKSHCRLQVAVMGAVAPRSISLSESDSDIVPWSRAGRTAEGRWGFIWGATDGAESQ